MKITINEILGLLLIVALVIWTYYPLASVALKKKSFFSQYSFEKNFKQGARLILLIISTTVAGLFLIGWFVYEIGTLSITL